MAICTQCGSVFNNEDIFKHQCSIIIPKGKEMNLATNTIIDMVTKE